MSNLTKKQHSMKRILFIILVFSSVSTYSQISTLSDILDGDKYAYTYAVASRASDTILYSKKQKFEVIHKGYHLYIDCMLVGETTGNIYLPLLVYNPYTDEIFENIIYGPIMMADHINLSIIISPSDTLKFLSIQDFERFTSYCHKIDQNESKVSLE